MLPNALRFLRATAVFFPSLYTAVILKARSFLNASVLTLLLALTGRIVITTWYVSGAVNEVIEYGRV